MKGGVDWEKGLKFIGGGFGVGKRLCWSEREGGKDGG